MNCPECLDLLQRRLDGLVLTGRTELDRHLAECPECRARHRSVQHLSDGLRLLDWPAPPAGLSQRIAGRILAERRAALTFRRRVLTASAVAAGLVLASLAAIQIYRAGTESSDGPQLVKNPVPKLSDKTPGVKKNEQPPPSVVDPSFDETLSEAGSAAVALTRRAADQTVASAQRWLPRTASLGLSIGPVGGDETLAPVLGPLAKTLRQAGETVSTGLQPVTTSAPRAWHTCTDFVEMFLQEGQPPQGKAKS
jgi:hypothetical protein